MDQALEQAWSLIEAGSGRSALPVLDAITEETWAAYEGLDDSDGEGIPLFSDIGAAWAEALLSPDVTGEERRTWGVKVESWQGELADYGLEEGFDGAVQAAEQGWDDRRLVRILRGEDTRERPVGQAMNLPTGSPMRRWSGPGSTSWSEQDGRMSFCAWPTPRLRS